MKLRKLKFFEKNFYSAKKVKEFFHHYYTIKNPEVILVFIEKLIKAYFKEYELKFVTTKLIYNNSKCYLNYVNKNDKLIAWTADCFIEYNNLEENKSNENFLRSLLQENGESFYCAKNAVIQQQNINEINDANPNANNEAFDFFNLKLSESQSNTDITRMTTDYKSNKFHKAYAPCRFKNIEKFLFFCQEEIYSNCNINKEVEILFSINYHNNYDMNTHYDKISFNLNDSIISNFTNNSFDFSSKYKNKDLDTNQCISACSYSLEHSLLDSENFQMKNISKSK